MKKFAIVVGARPQFIKLAPLIDILRDKAALTIIHTGQHYDFEMSDIFFQQLHLPKADYHLGVGSAGQASQVGQMMIKLEDVFIREKPSMVIVIGDTNSTLAGALAAAKLNILLAHIEAGLRSKDKYLPEQINRIVTDRLSDILCCPDQTSVDNLKQEGITKGVYLSGDILYDLINKIEPDDNYCNKLLTELKLERGNYILMTIHRAENADNPIFLRKVIEGLEQIPRIIFLPLHPRTEKSLKKHGLYEVLESNDHIKISKPVGIIESLALTKSSLGVITDSGGLQREAAYFGKRAYILRDETEWLELEKYGAVKCIGSDITKSDFIWDRVIINTAYFKKSAKLISEAISN